MKSLIFILLLSVAAFASQEVLEEEDVLVLNTDNFDQVIDSNPLILVEFYAPWCGHCKKLAPEYAKAAGELKGKIPLAKVNADEEENRPLATRFQIQGFPTLKVFRNGQPSDYNGDRTAASLVQTLTRLSLPAVSVLTTSDEVKEFSGKENVVIIGFFDSETSADYEAYKQTAEALRENFIFGAVVGDNAATIAKENGADAAPAVILFKKFDEGKNILPAAELSTIQEFVAKNSIPIIDEIGPNNYRKYMEASLPLAYLFVDLTVDGQKDTFVDRVRDIAKTTKGKLNWVYIDHSKYSRQGERLGLSGKTVPALAIEDPTSGFHYVFDESAEIATDAVQSWVNKFVGNELAPTVKSEEIPESNDGPVKVVVAKNYDDIVLNAEKDVLVEFYAPWCGHCKKLAPIYEEVGSHFLEHAPNVVVAKLDATANDIDPKLGVRGYPTLKFFPANNKTPIDYNGDRSKEDLIAFITKHASIPIAAHENKDEL